MKKFALCILCIALIFPTVNASACTIFMQSGGDMVLAGNNEDFSYAYASTVWVTQNDGEYARICFGNSTYVQGGMNEKGLFYDGAACPQSNVPNDANKATLGMDAGDVVLSNCATVEEAVAFLEDYNIVSGYGDHLLFADSSGDAAVVEWLEGEMRVIRAEDNRLIATNFFLTNTNLGGYPCNRYNTVETALKELASPTPENFASILSAASQDWGDGGTKYSNVYDLKALTVYVYQNADFSNVAVISLSDALSDSNYGFPTNISALDYQPAASVFDGTPSEDTDVSSEPAPFVSETPVPADTGVSEPDSGDDGNPYISALLFVGGVIAIVLILTLINRRQG